MKKSVLSKVEKVVEQVKPVAWSVGDYLHQDWRWETAAQDSKQLCGGITRRAGEARKWEEQKEWEGREVRELLDKAERWMTWRRRYLWGPTTVVVIVVLVGLAISGCMVLERDYGFLMVFSLNNSWRDHFLPEKFMEIIQLKRNNNVTKPV